jgi:predicted DNA-binding protein with PD1-like motif
VKYFCGYGGTTSREEDFVSVFVCFVIVPCWVYKGIFYSTFVTDGDTGMKYSEARQGRVFIVRLEDGEIVHEVIEKFAVDHNISAASLIVVGGADDGSTLVVGPESDRDLPLQPMQRVLKNAHEVAGTGTLFCDSEGTPLLHMHMACGRQDETITGCIRSGVKVWRIMEVIIQELLDTEAKRVMEAPLDLKLLHP